MVIVLDALGGLAPHPGVDRDILVGADRIDAAELAHNGLVIELAGLVQTLCRSHETPLLVGHVEVRRVQWIEQILIGGTAL